MLREELGQLGKPNIKGHPHQLPNDYRGSLQLNIVRAIGGLFLGHYRNESNLLPSAVVKTGTAA